MICKSNKSNTPPNCATCVVRGKSIFSSLCDKEIEKISQYIKKKSTYLAGEYLINEHDSEHYSLCVNSGYLILGAHLEDGSRQIFKVILPGESVGFTNTERQGYGYFVQAITNVDVCIINSRSVEKLLKEHSDVALQLIKILSDNSSSYQQYLLGLGRKDAKEALAYLIMDLYTRIQEQDTDNSEYEQNFFPLNQEDMADVLGLTKVHLSRVMSQFKKDNLIECGHKKLKVLDAQKLSKIGAYPFSL
ncbi:Crp/Fnr family transcriptional regulator [bacterium]|nr:Crp/Fnr family transcriptional regulator [bacterium]